MGMDVFGNAPISEKGKYFRNNAWHWRPLWKYTCDIGASVINEQLERAGHLNNGSGVDGASARRLAELLETEVKSGRTALYAAERDAALAALPLHDCPLCHGTGARRDDVGVEMGMTERWNPHTGKPGWCNGCDGEGKEKDIETRYQFSVENVQEFIGFLRHCGGFRIC